MNNHDAVALYIASKLRDYRFDNTLNQYDLAEITGLSQASIARIENCRLKSLPDLRSLAAITKFTTMNFKIIIENGIIRVE